MRRTLIKLLSALVVACLLLAGLYYGYLTWQLQPKDAPPEVLAAEQALADTDTVALLYFDVASAVQAEQIFLGTADRDALRGPMPGGNPVLGLLWSAGVDLRRSLDHVVAGASLSDQSLAWATILTGRFPVEEIRKLLERDSLISAGEGGVLLVSSEDLDRCQVSEPVAVFLAPDRIVLGSPERVARVVERLSSGAAAGLDLTPWRRYRRARLLSLALLVPPMEIGKQVDDPAARFASQAADGGFDPVERLYIGARVATLPPELVLDARIEASDSAWPAQMALDYEAWRGAFAAQMERRLPALARLQSHAAVAAEGASLLVETTLSERFLADLAELPGEVIRLAFSGLGVENPPGARQAAAEKTLDPAQVTAYRTNLSSSDLKAFDPTLDQSFKAQGESGPFGYRIKALRLIEPIDPVIQLELEVASGAIPNLDLDAMHLGESEPRAEVFITDVRDKAGASLLRAERCGPDRNALGAALETTSKQAFRDNSFVPVSALQGTKTVRLRPGTVTADIGDLEGVIELRLPTRIETQRLKAPFENQVVERAGARIKFTEAEPGQVKYEISGKADRVLAVRALNRRGEYLAPAGSFSSGRLLGPGKTVGRDYQGLPAELEVIVASGVAVLKYPFNLSTISPSFNVWDYPKPVTVRRGTQAAFVAQAKPPARGDDCQGTASGGQLSPFWLCFDSLGIYWGENVGVSGRLMAPASAQLAGNLSALELRIGELGLVAAGGAPLPVAFGRFLELNAQDEQLSGWFNGQIAVPEVAGLSDARFSHVAGRVILRLPKRLSRLVLDVSELGNGVRGDDGRSATLVAYNDGALELELTGPRKRLVQFIPRDSQGVALATSGVRLEPGEAADHWRASLRSSGRPATLEVVYAEQQDEKVYDYRLELEP